METSRIIEIDLTGVATAKELHDRLAQALSFPDYYGGNWDAFDECIHNLKNPPKKITIRAVRALETQLPREARLLSECFHEYQQTEEGRGVEVDIL